MTTLLERLRRTVNGVPLSAMLAAGVVVAVPPSLVVRWLRPEDGAEEPWLMTSIWLLKALVLVHVIAATWLAGRLPRSTEPSRPFSWSWPVAGLLALGLVLRLPGLGEGLWFDEIQTLVDYIRQPWGVLLTTFDSTNQHFLYSVTARAVVGLAGESASALRLPALLFGVASLWAAVVHGRRWLRGHEVWWVAALLAVSYHHIWFSQNARGYTGLLLGTLMATTIFLDLMRGTPATPRRIWAYSCVAALTILTHATAAVMVASHGLVWLWHARRLPAGAARWGPLVALVLSGTLAVTAYLPVLPQLLTALAGSGTGPVATEWQNPVWFLAESLRGLVQGVPGGVVVVPVALLVTAAGMATGWRRDSLATALALAPLAMMALLLLATGHNFWPRFFFFGAAFLVQFAVLGGFAMLERFLPEAGRKVGTIGLGAAVVGSLVLLPRAWAPKQDYLGAVEWLAPRVQEGDVVIGTAMMDLPMNRWLGMAWPVVDDLTSLQALEAAHRRSWVLYTFPIRLSALSPDLWAHLDATYQVAHVSRGSIGGGDIVILVRPPLPPRMEVVP